MRIEPLGHTARIKDGPEDAPPALTLWQKTVTVLSRTFSLLDRRPWSLWLDTSWAGKRVDADAALRLSAVWGCVRLLCETMGTLPVHVYEVSKGGGTNRTREHELNAIFLQPNRYMTWVEYMEAMQANLVLHGNGCSEDEFTPAGYVASTLPLITTGLQLERRDNGSILYRFGNGGREREYPEERITHLKGFGSDGMMGLSPIGYARESIGLAMATEEYGARFFSNGARPSGFLKFPGILKPEQREQARKAFENIHQGVENAHKLAILEGGVDYTPISVPPEDAQFIESRKFSIPEICRIFRVPPHMIADLDRSTNNNIEQQALEFVKYTLLPYLTRWEQRMNLRWIRPQDRGRFFVSFNLEGLLRPDTAARGEFYSRMVQNGIYSRNECRAKEKLNPVDGGDELTVQVNLMPLSKLPDVQAPGSKPQASGSPTTAAPSEAPVAQ